MPVRLEPKVTKRSLTASVKIYFYTLYNAADGKFKEFLASVGNKDAITGNRMFDRGEAVAMILAAAKESKDTGTANAKKGDIYKCIVQFMRAEGLGLKLRKQEYQRLTHQAPAE